MRFEGDWRSLSWKARTKVARWLTTGHAREAEVDDFDWSRYHLEYGAQICDLDEQLMLRLDDASICESTAGRMPSPSAPLHSNHRLIYEFACALQPKSILELGCGGGDHLANLSLLLPHCDIKGIDRSSGQLALLARRNPQVSDGTSHFDLTLPLPESVNGAEFVFTQAVIMHIQTGNGHRVALWNALNRTSSWLLLVENWGRHDFVRDIRLLVDSGRTPWDSVTMVWIENQGARALAVAPGPDAGLPDLPVGYASERVW